MKTECPALDEDFRHLVDALSQPGVPTLNTAGPLVMRAMLSQLSPRGGPALEMVRDVEFGGVRGREYVPAAANGTIVFYHGGGWLMGSVDDYDCFTRTLADATGARVLSVEYRLAPEHPFPAGVDDAWSFLRAVEPSGPLFVAGDSAGGNFSAVMAQMARDEGGPVLAGQILIYPSVAGDSDSAAMHAFVPPTLRREEIATSYDIVVPERAMQRDPRFAPALGKLKGLPPALIITAGADLLAHEAEEYAAQLAKADVSVRLHREGGAPHAFMTLVPQSRAAKAAMKSVCEFIGEHQR